MNLPWLEYCIVALSLAITVAIGLYFSQGVSSVKSYMLGNQGMSIFPISLSIAATYLSSSSMVSTAQEVYLFGMQTWFLAVTYILVGWIFANFFLPVSYSVKSASTFEFFSRRFNGHVRKFASVMYALEMIFYTSVSIYIPSVTLAQATGYQFFPIACVLSAISWLYTSTGGLRAVTYADSFQAVMFIGVILVLFGIGLSEVGGVFELWRKGAEGARVEFFDFKADYTVRYSLLIGLTGGTVVVGRSFTSPSCHQRIVAMSSYEDAKKATIWSSIMTGLCLIFTYIMGLVVYAYFEGCDPVLNKKDIKTHATILPYFVTEIATGIPGLMGLFLSGVIAAGLSSTTSCWNTVSCTLYEDVVLLFLPKNTEKKTAMRILTVILTIVAVISTACCMLIDKFPSLTEASVTMKSFTTCSSFTLYVCGMVLPWINSKGAISGSIISSIVTSYIALGAQHAKRAQVVKDIPKILTTAKCLINGTTMAELNQTLTVGLDTFGLMTTADPDIPWYFKISMGLYCVPGILLGLFIAVMVSLMTGFEDLEKIDREMIIPSMRWALPPLTKPDDDAEIPLNGKSVTNDATV